VTASGRVVVVSSFPPRHCGIGAYAAAQVAGLREAGSEVLVVSPPDGDGDVRVPFTHGRPFREALRRSGPQDRVLVHFQPALYDRRRDPVAKIRSALGLLRLCRRRPGTEVLVHEADPPRRWRPDHALLRAAFRAAPALVFHTDAERRALERAYRVRVRGRLVEHARGVRLSGRPSQEEARRALDIAPDEPLLVCPGFLHPDKGLERAVSAFAAAGRGRLAIVGEVRDPTPANTAYAARLREQVERVPGAVMIEGYLPDAEFDAWIAAADAVVLPYRRSWSSGALARAQLLGTPAIVTAVGGLAEQAGDRDVVVADDRALARAVARVCGRGVGAEAG
jgi:glycosyltransferase involved in cell wall biosynthesis